METLKINSNVNTKLIEITKDGCLKIYTNNLTLDELAEKFIQALERQTNRKIDKVEIIQ